LYPLTRKKLIIYCVTDDKPGHKSQLDGLLQALQNQVGTLVQWVHIASPLKGQLEEQTEKPDLILAAGHRTHLTALRLKWRFGGKLVVLMKPSLPAFLFDLCIIPEHDGVRSGQRVICTQGVLNTIRPSRNSDENVGLILMGGPSKHHGWSDTQMVEQLRQLKLAMPKVQWTLTTSRRTPVSFLTTVNSLLDGQFKVVPVENTNRDWLMQHYQQCGVIWVSEDSVSMVYESLSTGAKVGVLEVPRLRQSRVSQGLDKLLTAKRLTRLNENFDGGMVDNSLPLFEAQRIAEVLLADLKKSEAFK